MGPSARTGVADRIADDLRARIESGELRPGALLPGRRALALRYGAALPTVERAVASLLADGLVRAENRRGTFVADGPAKPVRARRRAAGVNLGVIGTLHRLDEGAENHRLWVDSITRGIESVAAQEGLGVRFADRWRADGSLTPLAQILEQFQRDGVAAVAMVGDTVPVESTVPALAAAGMPFVFAGAGIATPGVHTVQCDGRAAGALAAAHLLALGCGSLHFLVPFSAPWIDERIEGARLALRQAGLPDERLQVYPARPETYAQVVARTRQIYATPGSSLGHGLLRATKRPAILTVNDLTALAILEAGHRLGKAAGRDFALVGFDDEPRSRFANLTTLRPPLAEMGIEAALLLLRLMDGAACARHVLLQPTLIPRGSTRGFQQLSGRPSRRQPARARIAS